MRRARPFSPPMSRIAIVLWLFVSSCASIMTGGTDDILVTSEPSGVFFKTDLGHHGRTPMTISVTDHEPVHFLFRQKGFESYETRLNRRMSLWIVGNAVIGGPIGVLIDLAGGNGWVHAGDRVHVKLRASSVGPPDPEERAETTAAPPRETFEEWSARRQPPAATGDGTR